MSFPSSRGILVQLVALCLLVPGQGCTDGITSPRGVESKSIDFGAHFLSVCWLQNLASCTVLIGSRETIANPDNHTHRIQLIVVFSHEFHGVTRTVRMA
jgi:hypothetical protein